MPKKRTIAVIALAVLLAGALTAYELWTKAGDELHVGAILPLSGDGASYGKTMQNGIELFLVERQESGAGAFQVIYEDTRLNPSKAVTAFRKLVSVDDVPVVIGPFTSSQMMAVGPVAQQKGRVLISGTATSPDISGLGDYIFRIIPSDTYDGRVVAHLIRRQLRQARQVVVVSIKNDYGAGIRAAFSREAERLGLTIAREFRFPPDTSDFRVMVQRIKDIAPDAVFLVGYKEMGRFLRQAQEASLDLPIVSTGLMEDPEIVEIAQGGADGVMYSYPSFNPESGRQYVAEFTSSYENRYDKEPDVIAALGYDLASLVDHVLATAPDTSPAAIRDRLLEVKAFPGVAGDITFNFDGDVQKISGIKMIRDGEFVWITEELSVAVK